MPIVENEEQAEKIIRSYYAENPFGPMPVGFLTSRKRDTWIVTFDLPTSWRKDRFTATIDSKTGEILKLY